MRIILLPLMLAPALAAAQQPPPPRPPHPTVRTHGEAIVSAKPDRARIDIGVVTQAPAAQTAASQNAAKADAVIREMKTLAGANAEVKTVSYSVTPNYTYPRDGRPIITGYTATNVVQVMTEDLAGVGKLIDAATQTGANQVNRLEFTLKDPQAAHAQALQQAAAKARANAEALASALGLRITRIIAVEEEGPAPEPIRPMAAMARAETPGAPTPVESGMIEFRAAVTLTAEVQ